jgi:hypothetical protein
MIVIKRNQIEALSGYKRDTFIKRVLAHMRSDFRKELSEQGIRDEVLARLVSDAVDRAETYNVVNESDVTLFVECIAILGPDFDRNGKYPEVGEILSQDDLDGEEKMDAISDFLTFEKPAPV